MAAVPAEARRRAKSTSFVVGMAILVTGVVAVIIVSQSSYNLTQSQWGIVTQFGLIRSVESTPGLHFKIPFVQQVTYVDRGFRVSAAPPTEYLTSDQKRILVGHGAQWRIVDPRSFFLRLNTESVGNARLERLVDADLRQRIAATPYGVMISVERDAVMDQVRDAVQAQVDEAGWGIEVTRIVAVVIRVE